MNFHLNIFRPYSVFFFFFLVGCCYLQKFIFFFAGVQVYCYYYNSYCLGFLITLAENGDSIIIIIIIIRSYEFFTPL